MAEHLVLDEMRKIIDEDRFSVLYHPIVYPTTPLPKKSKPQAHRLQLTDVLKFEALVRFPEMPTESTIRFLESNPAMMMELTRKITKRVTDFIRSLKEADIDGFPPISINAPPYAFLHENKLHEFLKDILRTQDLEGSMIEMEMTEGGIKMKDIRGIIKEIRGVLRKLKTMGIIVVEDDFGDGTAIEEGGMEEIKVLKKLQFKGFKVSAGHLLKGDISALPEAIEHAKQNGVCIVIEQVRNKKTLDAVRKKMQDYCISEKNFSIQGYVYSEPLSEDQVRELCISSHKKIDHLLIAA